MENYILQGIKLYTEFCLSRITFVGRVGEPPLFTGRVGEPLLFVGRVGMEPKNRKKATNKSRPLSMTSK